VVVELWKKIFLEEVDPSDKIWRINVAEKVFLGRLLRKIVKRQVIVLKVIVLIALELLHKTVELPIRGSGQTASTSATA